MDDTGRAVAAWQVVDASGTRLALAEEDAAAPGRFALRAPVGATDGAAQAPSVAAGPDGAALVTWWVSEGEQTRVQWSERASGRWADHASPDDALSSPPRAYEPRAAISPSGEEAIVWNQWTGEHYAVLLARRPSPSEEWQFPTGAADALSQPLYYANAPLIALDSIGDAIVVWYQSTGGPLMVYASERDGADGAFSRPAADAALSAPGAPVDSHPIANPTPAFGPDGAAAVVWTQEDGEGATPVYLARRDRDGPWQAPTDLGDALPPAEGVARCAQLLFRASGSLVVAWQQERDDQIAVLAVELPPGQRRASSEEVETLSTPDAWGLSPVLAASGDEVVATWLEQRTDGAAVVVRRLGSQWGPTETLSGGEDAGPPAIATGANRTLVAWPEGPTAQARVRFAIREAGAR